LILYKQKYKGRIEAMNSDIGSSNN
jgi:hypothetical protein